MMVDLAKTLNSTDMIELSLLFAQQPRNSVCPISLIYASLSRITHISSPRLFLDRWFASPLLPEGTEERRAPWLLPLPILGHRLHRVQW